jgi:hypothetical protein
MSLSPSHPGKPAGASLATYHKIQRACLAGCVVLAPLVIFLGFIFDPTRGVPHGASSIFAQFQAASQWRVQVFLYLNAVTPYFFPLSFLALGLLAMRRAPALASIGTALGLIGSIPWALFIGQEALVAVMAQTSSSAAFASVWNSVSAEGAVGLLQYSWVIGHLLGYLLLGIAFIRARAIPPWAAWLFIISVPLQMASYPTQQGIYQILGFVLVFLGSLPAAWALLKPIEAADSLLADQPAMQVSGAE